jgi:hypothetical protein
MTLAVLATTTLAVAAVPLEQAAVAAEVSEPLRIMPIGDSITEAKWKTPGRDSYRLRLWERLQTDGYHNVDFVGSRLGVKDNENPPGDWDKDHEGHYGWRADEIVSGKSTDLGAGKLADWAATYRPDVALVHIGTNDANQGQTTASTVQDIGRIIEVLRDHNPQVKIAVAQVIPWTKTTATNKAVVALNATIPDLAAMSTADSPVVIVDHHTGYDPACNYDKIHPKPCGHLTMTERWMTAMVEHGFLPGTTPRPEPVNTAPTVDAGSTRSVTLPTDTVDLAGTVSDDGLPNPPASTTAAWSLMAGPGPVSFADPGDPTTTVRFATAGSYTLLLSGSDGALSASDTVAVTVNETSEPGSGRVADALLALYEFDENGGSVARDTSGHGEPLDLTVQDPSAVTWAPGVLTLHDPTALMSATSAAKVSDAVKSSNEVTIEAWVDPANLSQPGPARIVTISKSTSLRNLTLGQESTYVVGRFRTSTTGNNGTSPATASGVGSLPNALVHLVYTRDVAGSATIYIDGAIGGTQTVTGTTSTSWDSSYPLLLGTELGGNRPWLGEYHLVALYGRALSAAEVGANYAAGANP